MKKSTNGGPAFPTATTTVDNNGLPLRPYEVEEMSGMSLRDFFAASFMRSHIQMNEHNINEHQAREAARFAFMVADAMLAAR